MSPIIVLNLEVEANNYDINVSPDKREIFIKNEAEAMEVLSRRVEEFFEEIQRTNIFSVPRSKSGGE